MHACRSSPVSQMSARTVAGVGEREINEQWAAWLRRRMRTAGFGTPTELGRASGVDQSVISRWLNEGRTPQVDQLRKIGGPLDASMLDLLIAAGYVARDEIDVTEAATTTVLADVAEAIRQDAGLIEEARAHLLTQYDLLRRLSPSPSEARGKQTPRRAKTPSDQPPLRAVARGGDPAHREEVSRMARRVREQQTHGEGTEDKT